MRTILHCDINNCFASIEALRDPSLRGRAIAVCGDPAERRGIVLAKSEAAKQCGVKTGDALWEARQKCPDIIFVAPHYDLYVQVSRKIRHFYESLTPRVEPFGLDECWLDMTQDVRRIGLSGVELGEFVRRSVKDRFSLTISVGVSFNKVFAKLGSDYKKPDAVTEFNIQNFRQLVWPLPTSDLLWVGRSTSSKLARFGIGTIGEIARTPRSFMIGLLGKNGLTMWQNANGLDMSEVVTPSELAERQSLGHGTTLPRDLTRSDEVWPVLLRLAGRVADGLRAEGFLAQGVSLYVRDAHLQFHQYYYRLEHLTDAAQTLAEYGFMLFRQRYAWQMPVRAIGITAVHLVARSAPHQLSLFDAPTWVSTHEAVTRPVEVAMSRINEDLGEELMRRAATLDIVKAHGTGFGRPSL